jgi:hypothetical protein
VQAGRCRLSILAYVIRGKCIRMMFEFEGLTYVDCACLAGLPPKPRPQGPPAPLVL